MFLSNILSFGLLLLVIGSNGSKFFHDGITVGQFLDQIFEVAYEKYPNLKGIGSIDPMDLGDFTTKNGDLVIKNSNTVLTGLRSGTIYGIDWDFENNEGKGQVYADITLKSDYETSGKFLNMPISSTGKLVVEGKNLAVDVRFKFRTIVVDTQAYFDVFDIRSSESFGDLKFNLTSYGGGKVVDNMINSLLNNNWEDLEEAGTKQTSAVITPKIAEYLNRILHQIPLFEFLQYAAKWVKE